MASFQERIIRAAKLDVNLYEEVEADKTGESSLSISNRLMFSINISLLVYFFHYCTNMNSNNLVI